MRVTDWLYSLVLRVYPRDFRCDREDELLSTLAEEREDTGVTLALAIQGGDLHSGLPGLVLALILPMAAVCLYARRRRSALIA